MHDTPTAKALVEANRQLRYLECGGESKFRSVEEARAEIERLRLLKQAEDYAALVARRATVRAELIDADIAVDVARAALDEARATYARLKDEASRVEVSLRWAGQEARRIGRAVHRHLRPELARHAEADAPMKAGMSLEPSSVW